MSEQQQRNRRKYIVLVGDGMADYEVAELGGKTPLEAALTPNMDRVACCHMGLVRTIPQGMEPGSDVANLALLGYDPSTYHTGRAPLEAASMGVSLGPLDVAFRMNLVCLERRSRNEIVMISHSSGDLTTQEGRRIVDGLKGLLEAPGMTIHAGVGYRHLIVWENGPDGAKTIPPHDVLDQNMAPYLESGAENPIPELIRRSWAFLEKHPVNLERKEKGLLTADSIWPWGQGKAPKIPLFQERFGLRGGVVSAVDLLKGIGVYAGLTPLHVPGATGYLDTDYEGKVNAALNCLDADDFVFVHVEAPDETSHAGNLAEKLQAIEDFDSRVVGPVLERIARFDECRVMVVSDHYTPLIERTHTLEPPPFAWADTRELSAPAETRVFSERAARNTGVFFDRGHELMAHFIDAEA